MPEPGQAYPLFELTFAVFPGIKRRKDGRWEGRYVLETAEGPKRRYVYGKTRKEGGTLHADRYLGEDGHERDGEN